MVEGAGIRLWEEEVEVEVDKVDKVWCRGEELVTMVVGEG